MIYRLLYFFTLFGFLIPSTVRFANEVELNRINQFDAHLENIAIPVVIKEVRLFGNEDYDFEYQYFVPPAKITLTDLNPLYREISLAESSHLLRRTTIGPTIEEINDISALNISNAVDYILREIPEPPTPGDWVDDPFPSDYSDYNQEQRDSLNAAYQSYNIDLNAWWLDQMYYNSSSIKEQMTLFWHDHFATSIETVKYPPAMYHQNRVLRENALGNFKDLVILMTFDPAMMVWLDNRENRVGAINENFSRELLELFTMGEGNYTQQDVMEAARGLTGYQTDGLNTYFNPNRFDDGVKTFLGQTGNFDSYDIIEIIFDQPETAYFISEKLYKWFVYENPNEVIVEQLAQILVENNYEIKPVLSVLLNSEHFYDQNFRGSKYKNPITHSVGSLKQLYIDIDQTVYAQNNSYTFHEILTYVQNLGGQLIFYPPDVSGWPGYRNWINSFTLPNRKLFTNYLFDDTFIVTLDLISLAERIPDGLSDPNALLDYLYVYFYSIEPSELTKQNLMDELLAGADPFEWHLIYYDGAVERLNTVVQRMMRLSEYQLK
tara:strand:- start:2692 stop:4338 length:1647 start_codon:yes stop_codon:yes gene_type:complete